jgi:hypothetical protein
MNYFRFSLLQSYISSIKKNKKRAILLINTGIFFSIFAFSSAIITFLIERDISKKQSEILQYQISIKEMSKTIAELEMMYNNYTILIENETNARVDKQFFSETVLGNKIISANDFYTPYIQYSAESIEIFQQLFSSDESEDLGLKTFSDLFNINSEFNQFFIDIVKDEWPQEDIEDLTDAIQKAGEAYSKIKDIEYEKYNFKKFQTLEEIITEIERYQTFHLNSSNSKLIDDYFAITNFEYAMLNWFSKINYLMKSFNASDSNELDNINNEIKILSKKEKNIILLTFVFQLFVFLIIQVFEINSINFKLRKK